MKLLKDLWGWIKEWNDWQLKDWIKAGILVVIVSFLFIPLISNYKRR